MRKPIIFHSVSFDQKRKVCFLDAGIVDLVSALNQIRGVETVSSCDGHGEKPVMVGMDCTPESAMALLNLIVRKGNAIVKGIGHPDNSCGSIYLDFVRFPRSLRFYLGLG